MLPDMVSLQMVLAAASVIITTLLGAWVALFRYTVSAKEAEFERRLATLKEDLAAAVRDARVAETRANGLEMELVELRGKVALTEQHNGALSHTIAEIKNTMVTIAIWEQRTSNLERSLNRVLDDIGNLAKRGYQSNANMPAVTKR